MAKKPPNHHIPLDLLITDDLINQGAELYGTPLYIYDKFKLEENWDLLTNSLPKKIKVYYSVKANPGLAIINTFSKLGANFEVASVGELKAVLRVGVSPSRIIFVGPGKTNVELKYAIKKEIYSIICESPREVYKIQRLAKDMGKHPQVALRINPGTGKGMLSMGGATQFGMEQNTALSILRDTGLENVKIIGIQSFLGTQILDWEVILEQSRLIFQIADELQQKSGVLFSFIDLGGGFGIPYYELDKALNLSLLHSALTDLLDEYFKKYPTSGIIAIESGRFLVGSSGVFVTRVVDIKSFNKQYFVVLDGGINAFGGQDRYVGSRPVPIRVLDKETEVLETLTLCGPLCTPLDRLAANVLLPMPKYRSLVVFYLAGAYGFSASPGLFLSHGFSCEALVTGGNLELIRQRYLPDEFLSNQIFPV